MSRPLHPLACRIGRAERASIVAFAHAHGVSVSGLMKTAVRQYITSQPAVVAQPVLPTQPPVNVGVNRALSDTLRMPSPPLLRPFKMARGPVRHASSAVGGGSKGRALLSDF
jgi:hypothetical protein